MMTLYKFLLKFFPCPVKRNQERYLVQAPGVSELLVWMEYLAGWSDEDGIDHSKDSLQLFQK